MQKFSFNFDNLGLRTPQQHKKQKDLKYQIIYKWGEAIIEVEMQSLTAPIRIQHINNQQAYQVVRLLFPDFFNYFILILILILIVILILILILLIKFIVDFFNLLISLSKAFMQPHNVS
jgi:hypothetical protein